jgi:hypothetical protein
MPSAIQNVLGPSVASILLALGVTIPHATIVKSCNSTSKESGLIYLAILYGFLGVVMLLGRQMYNICRLSSKTITAWKSKQYVPLKCYGVSLCPDGQKFECKLPAVGIAGIFMLILLACGLLAAFAYGNAQDSEKDEMNVGSMIISFVVVGLLLFILWFTLRQHCSTHWSSGLITVFSYFLIVVAFGVTLPTFKSLFQKFGVKPKTSSPAAASNCNSTQSSKILFSFVGLSIIAYLVWGNMSARYADYTSTAISSTSSTGMGCSQKPDKIGSMGMQWVLWLSGFLLQAITYWIVA